MPNEKQVRTSKPGGKQVRISNGAHAALSDLSSRHEQPIGITLSHALALYTTIVERLERQAGSKIYIETDDEKRQELVLPILPRKSGAEESSSSEALEEDATSR